VLRRDRSHRRVVDTLKTIPAPRSATFTFEVDGEHRTLTEWSQSSGIAKATLDHRLSKGLTMKAAIALGRGVKGRVLVAAKPTRKDQLRRPRAGARVSRSKLDCRTGAANTVDSGHTMDTPETNGEGPRTWRPLKTSNSRCPGAESNRRHADFQSAALPTELPGHPPPLLAGGSHLSRAPRRVNSGPPPW
jgi:hypothetical protein